MAVARIAAWRDIDLSAVRLADGKDGFKRSWIMLMPEGEFDHPQYGKLEFSRKKLEEFKQNFDGKVRHIDIALDQDHDGGKATGWLEQLQLRDGGLWGLVRWTSLGARLLKDQIYRYFSPEFGKFNDPESGKTFQNVIIGGALTNRPFLKNMPAVQLAEVSRRSWSSVDKSKLPASCFLIVGDRSKKTTWRLPVYEGAGDIGADGMYTKRGPLNLNGVRAAIDAIGGARTGSAMTGVPGGLRAKLEGWLKRYGDSAATASEGAATVATRKATRKLADTEPEREEQVIEQPSDDEETEDALDVLGEDGADAEDEDEETDELDEGDEEDETQELADKPPFKGAMKPFGKGGKRKVTPAEDDAEDKADGGADEDAEELDDMTDEEYDEANADAEDEEEKMMPAPKGRGKGKGMPTAPVKKMSETQLLAENRQLREEVKQLREEQFKLSVARKLSEFTRGIRADGDDEEFALPRSFKLAYQEHMFEHGFRLSEAARDSLDNLVKLALRVGTVPLTSLANQISENRVNDADDRRPRTSFGNVDQTDEAEKIALSEYKTPLNQLVRTDPAAVEKIYTRLEEARKRKGKPAA